MECLVEHAMGSWPNIVIGGAIFYTLGRVRPLRSLGLWPTRQRLVEAAAWPRSQHRKWHE